jgi:Skp family chaperone for outer membrane proteins
MRKGFLFIFLALIAIKTVQAQTKGTKVGYIDMEYILQNVPDYTEAQNQLEQKAQIWKQEIEAKKNEINKLKEALKAEKALLTKGLIEERINEIVFLENENLEYQQKRFGPNGDLMTQKLGLTKPIQDQVFTAVQDIAEVKNYDFIFDKTSDMTILFAAKRFDISDQIVRVLNRTEKREQLTKKQLKEEAEKEAKEETMYDNPELAKKQKSLDAKKAARDLVISNKLLADEERRKAVEERKLKIIADREAKKNGVTPSTEKTAASTNTADKEAAAQAANDAKKAQAEQRAETIRIRNEETLNKKKALEERRLQILQEREAKKNGAKPSSATTVVSDTNNPATKAIETNSTDAEAKQKQADARAKTLEDRKKLAEENKKAQEEKRKQAIEAKNSKKTGTVSENSAVKEVETKPTTVTEPTKTATDDSKKTVTTETEKTSSKTAAEEAKQKQEAARAKTIEDRNKLIEERKKALEEKRKKILEDREAAKKANEEKLKTTKENTNNN